VSRPAAASGAPGDGFPLARVAPIAAAAGALLAAGLFAQPYANPDSHAFEALARSVLEGRGLHYREPLLPFVDLHAFRSPLYALFLALSLALGGVTVALVLQGALAGLTAALVGDLAARAAGRRAGWFAFGVAMVWPPTWQYAGQLMSETLYTALVVAMVWACVRAEMSRRWRGAAIAGLLAGLAVLTRSQGALVVPAVAVALAWRWRRGALVFACAALLAWAPWVVRNALHFEAFVPLLTSGGMNAWASATGEPIERAWELQGGMNDIGERGIDRHFYQLAREATARDPAGAMRRAAKRAVGYAVPVERDLWTALHRAIWPLALCALLWASTRRALALPGAVWLAHGAAAVLVLVNARYRAPSEWVVVLAASLAADQILRRLGPRRGALAVGGLLVLGGLVSRLVRLPG
jgi:4-amino-4-deoxy-L-arabinose transferase-like glycosyltransferase